MNRSGAIAAINVGIGMLKGLAAGISDEEMHRQGKPEPRCFSVDLLKETQEIMNKVGCFIRDEEVTDANQDGTCHRCGRYFRRLPHAGFCEECLNMALMQLGKRDAEFIKGQEAKEEDDDE